MKRWLAGAALAGLALLTGTSVLAQERDTDGFDKIRERGVLEVAVYDRFPPFSSEQNGQASGLDVDLAAALARELGLKLKVRSVIDGEDMDDDLRNFLWKGSVVGGSTVDLMMHIGADQQYVERQDKVLIFGVYLHEAVAVGLRAKRFPNFAGFDQLKGKKIAVELGSISDAYLSSAYGSLLRDSLVRYPDTAAAVTAFVKDEADAVVAPRAEMQGLLKQLGGPAVEPKQVDFTGMFRSAWDIGMAVKASAPKLKAALNEALIRLETSGELATIYAKYGLDYTRNQAAIGPGTTR